MRADRPSRTAQHNALFRAIEQRLPEPLFADPFARRFLRGRYRLAALLPAAALARAIDARWPGPRAAVCVRTRWIDDAIGAALARGLDQLVLLGAGFDARAHRLPGIERVRVFEVDHPATQAMKRRVVGQTPEHVTYVPVDLTRDALPEALARAGLRTDARTLFLWEGVTNYLDEPTVDATLRFAARAGQALLFTYVDRAVLDGQTRVHRRARVGRLREAARRAVHVRLRPGRAARLPGPSAGSSSKRTCRSRKRRASTTPMRVRPSRPTTTWSRRDAAGEPRLPRPPPRRDHRRGAALLCARGVPPHHDAAHRRGVGALAGRALPLLRREGGSDRRDRRAPPRRRARAAARRGRARGRARGARRPRARVPAAALRSGRAGLAPRDGPALGRGAAQPARDAHGARGARRAARRAREAAAPDSGRRRRGDRAPDRVALPGPGAAADLGPEARRRRLRARRPSR